MRVLNRRKFGSIVLITNLLVPPYDEGSKVVTMNLSKELAKQIPEIKIDHNNIGISTITNKQLYNKSVVLYLPRQSITFFSLCRLKLLKLFTNSYTIMISFQPRRYSNWQISILPLIKPDQVFVQSESHKDRLFRLGFTNVSINKWGIDTNKFTKVDHETKMLLRKKYNVPSNKTVYLHIGHLNRDRNLAELIHIAKEKNNFILFVCSTTTKHDEKYEEELMQAGINVLRKYVKDNQELYQLADYYIFPAEEEYSAIEFPLSVFEALSCGIPVLHKNFGALKDIFNNTYNNILSYRDVHELKHLNFPSGKNFDATKLTWEKVTQKILRRITP